MKHIKKYENKYPSSKYKVDDYVLVDLNKISGNPPDFTNTEGIKAKIFKINIYKEYPYSIRYGNDELFAVDESEISRKLTLEEIEDYEIEMQTKKYNL